MAPNLSFGSGSSVIVVLTGSPDPRQHPFEFEQQLVSGQLCGTTGGGPITCPGFLLPFGHRHWLVGSSLTRWGVGPCLRSAYRMHGCVRTPSGLPRSTRTRYDRGGCLLYPGGGGALPADKKSPTGACRFSAASPSTPPGTTHRRGSHIPRHQTEVHLRPPVRSALARNPRMERGSFGFPLSFAPRRCRRRTSRVGPGH
jgi:hypothetical protein